MTGRLYVCATPIGNLEDVSLRLLRVLTEVDAIAAEDTRRTQKLLTHHGIRAKLVSYHDANERAQTRHLIERIRRGDRIALVSDSGTPSISDPGFLLVTACIAESLPVETVPGPSAAVAALVVSGLPTARFSFEGFLSKKEGERSRRLERLKDDDRTLIFYEAPGRVRGTLETIGSVLGNRRVAVARELTKIHEQVIRGSVSEVLAQIEEENVRGEAVILVEGAAAVPDLPTAVEAARGLVAGGLPKGKAAAKAAAQHGVARREIYQRLLED